MTTEDKSTVVNELDAKEQDLLKKYQASECPSDDASMIELDAKEQELLKVYQSTARPSNKKHVFILLKDSGDLIAAMAEDGELRLGVDTTEAAKEFWKYVEKLRPVENHHDDIAITNLKANCYDLMQENKALKNKIALLVLKQ